VALSEVSVRAPRLKGAEEDRAVMDAKKNWPAWDRDIPVLLLRRDGAGRWRGFAINPREQRQPVTYDTISGLILSADAP
jgi:hypothetical protein